MTMDSFALLLATSVSGVLDAFALSRMRGYEAKSHACMKTCASLRAPTQWARGATANGGIQRCCPALFGYAFLGPCPAQLGGVYHVCFLTY